MICNSHVLKIACIFNTSKFPFFLLEFESPLTRTCKRSAAWLLVRCNPVKQGGIRLNIVTVYCEYSYIWESILQSLANGLVISSFQKGQVRIYLKTWCIRFGQWFQNNIPTIARVALHGRNSSEELKVLHGIARCSHSLLLPKLNTKSMTIKSIIYGHWLNSGNYCYVSAHDMYCVTYTMTTSDPRPLRRLKFTNFSSVLNSHQNVFWLIVTRKTSLVFTERGSELL